MTRAMVVGPLADWSTFDVAQGWAEGLSEIGCEVAYYDLSRRVLFYAGCQADGRSLDLDEARVLATTNLLGELYRFDPDVVVIVHGAHVWPPLLAELRCRSVWVLTECPYENEAQALTVAAAAPSLILLNDPEAAGVFASIAPAFYSPHAYRPALHRPDGPARPSDVCFVGTCYPERAAVLEGADWSGVDLALLGMWDTLDDDSPLKRHVRAADCIDNTEAVEWYRGARIGLNIYRTGAHGEHSLDAGWAIGPREVELAATGSFFLRDPRGESDELFPFLPSFTSAAELEELVRFWLPRDIERRDLGRRAREAVADRTFANHARRALRRLGL
jgi:hypothetical protein